MYSREIDEEMRGKKSLKRKAESQELHKEIEKRRRDRINQSLMELSQAIPPAFAKQSTRRLEKAEILEMTVHYIRAIGNTEIGARFQQGEWYSSDIWADFIHHYQSGYSDCMRELHAFYKAVEGRPDHDDDMNRVFTFLKSRYRPESSVADGEAFRRQTSKVDCPSPSTNTQVEQTRIINAINRNLETPSAKHGYHNTYPENPQLPSIIRSVEPPYDFRVWGAVPYPDLGLQLLSPFRRPLRQLDAHEQTTK